MDLRELEDLENTRAIKLAKNERNTDLSLIDIKNLYPEYSFAGTYGLKDQHVSLSKYLILYEQVLLNIHPTANIIEFEKSYGISFSDFLILVEAKKILPVICYPYYRFPSFFEQLFKLGEFPRSGRLRTYLEVIGDNSKFLIEERVKRLVREKNFCLSINRLFSNYHGSEKDKIDIFENSFSSDLYDFELLGMNDLVEVIFEIAETYPNEAYQITLDYCNCIGRPFFDNVGGINTFTDNTLLKAKQGYLKTKNLPIFPIKSSKQQLFAKKIESFIGVDPTELIGFIAKSIELDLPSTLPDTKGVIELLDNDPVITEMRSQLERIKNTELQSNSVNDFAEISAEVCAKLKKDSHRLKIVSEWSADIVLLGSILPSIAGQLYFDKPFTDILYGTVYPTLVGTQYEIMKEFSTQMTGSFFDKLTKKPMATLYWKSTKRNK